MDQRMKKRTDLSYTVGARLRLSRRRKRWTRPDLSRATGIPVNTIRQYEDGYSIPSAPRLVLLAQALEVEPGWLVPVGEEQKEGGK
jgi:transcriptional regulator with XRE-family HTH domain